MKYVLFREDSNSHQEIYITEKPDACDSIITRHVGDAIRFDTAREGYEYGGAKGLDRWRVGQR